ncbi:MAG: FAD-dependent oxidoreductase, partial [Pseudomonadota bacterium]
MGAASQTSTRAPRSAADIVVAGGGNAALCAAISAAERGLSVCVCEAAPIGFRGGNSRHTRNLRAAHDAPTEV